MADKRTLAGAGANWFVGLPVAAGEWLAPLCAGAPAGLRCLHPDDLHLTVAFLGAVGEERARVAWRVVEEAPLQGGVVVLAGLRAFGNPRRPTALSVEVEGAHTVAHRLIATLREPLLAAIDAPPDGRPIAPHLTVARPPHKASGALRRAAQRWAEGVAPLGVEVTLDRVALFTASDDRRERKYRAVVSRALAVPPPRDRGGAGTA